MPYRPSVVRQAPDVQDLGSAITRAFESHELSGMRKKAQEKEDFRFEREAEGHGFYRDEEVQPPAPRPQATSPESPQSPGGGYQDELVNAGVPENMAAAVSRDPTAARAFLAPPEEEPGYAMEDLVKLGLPPELARIVYGKPDLLEEILTDQQRAQLTRGTEAERARLRQEELRTASTLRRGDTSHAEGLRRERETAVQALRNAGGGAGGRRIADLKTAFDLLDRAYGEYDQWGELVGNTLGTQERFQLAEDLVAGTLDPSALPNPPVDEEPEVDDGPSWIDRLTGWISGAQPAAAEGRGPAPDDADPVEAEDPPAEDPQATIREAQSLIAPMLRRGTGGQSPSSIEEVRDMLVELEFTPEEIEMIVQPYIRGR
jgi:hypothetical protein